MEKRPIYQISLSPFQFFLRTLRYHTFVFKFQTLRQLSFIALWIVYSQLVLRQNLSWKRFLAFFFYRCTNFVLISFFSHFQNLSAAELFSCASCVNFSAMAVLLKTVRRQGWLKTVKNWKLTLKTLITLKNVENQNLLICKAKTEELFRVCDKKTSNCPKDSLTWQLVNSLFYISGLSRKL